MYLTTYFSFDCVVTFTITTSPLIYKYSSYFRISSATTSHSGIYTIDFSITDGINTINDSFNLIASFDCATSATINYYSTTCYYEVNDP